MTFLGQESTIGSAYTKYNFLGSNENLKKQQLLCCVASWISISSFLPSSASVGEGIFISLVLSAPKRPLISFGCHNALEKDSDSSFQTLHACPSYLYIYYDLIRWSHSTSQRRCKMKQVRPGDFQSMHRRPFISSPFASFIPAQIYFRAPSPFQNSFLQFGGLLITNDEILLYRFYWHQSWCGHSCYL